VYALAVDARIIGANIVVVTAPRANTTAIYLEKETLTVHAHVLGTRVLILADQRSTATFTALARIPQGAGIAIFAGGSFIQPNVETLTIQTAIFTARVVIITRAHCRVQHGAIRGIRRTVAVAIVVTEVQPAISILIGGTLTAQFAKEDGDQETKVLVANLAVAVEVSIVLRNLSTTICINIIVRHGRTVGGLRCT